jgi:hypothetical protein
MARVKGSKNKPKDSMPQELQDFFSDDQISEDKNLVKDPEPKKKVLIGYHPISGAEVWQ